MLETKTSIYVASIAAVGVLTLLWSLGWLRRQEQDRTTLLTKRSWFEGTLTRTPLAKPEEEARAQGVENIRRNTTVIRRALVPLVILLCALLASVPLLGSLPTALVSVMVAVVTVTTGIAARPIIENIFSGLVLSFSRILNIGDTVLLDDLYGTVEDITLTHTTVRLWDWRRYVVPNTTMMQRATVNYSLHDRYQWAYVEFWVSHDADLEVVSSLAVEAARQSDHYADYEPPRFWVMELGERGVQCWVAAWADTPSEAWGLKHDVRTALAKRLQQAGIPAHAYRVSVTSPPDVPPPTALGARAR